MQAGASDVTFGTAIGTGVDAKIAISADTCSGKTVPANQTCSLTLTATPDFFGPAQDVITLPDGGEGRKIPVTVNGYDTANGAYTPLTPGPAARHPEGHRCHDAHADRPRQDHRPAGDRERWRLRPRGATAVVLNVTVVSPTSRGLRHPLPDRCHPPGRLVGELQQGLHRRQPGHRQARHRRQGPLLQRLGQHPRRRGRHGLLPRHHEHRGCRLRRLLRHRRRPASSTPATPRAPARSPRRLLRRRGLDFGPDVNPHIKAFAVNITVDQADRDRLPHGVERRRPRHPQHLDAELHRGQDRAQHGDRPGRAPAASTACPGFETARSSACCNTSNGNAHVIVDLVGVYDDNTLDGMWRFRPLASPTRIVNTKAAQGIPAALAPGQTAHRHATPPR